MRLAYGTWIIPTLVFFSGSLSEASRLKDGQGSLFSLLHSHYLRRLNSRDIPVPFFRYIEWNDLEDAIQDDADVLGYNRRRWDEPGSANIEFLSYETINTTDIEQVQAIDRMGYTEDSWDCYINHYLDFDWEELEAEGVLEYIVALGWTNASWTEEEDPPESQDLDYDELNVTQQEAVFELCYFPETWDELALDEWDQLPRPPSSTPSAMPTGTPSSFPTLPPTGVASVAPSDGPTIVGATMQPTNLESEVPTAFPTVSPTILASSVPTDTGSVAPTTTPSSFPTPTSSVVPTMPPSGVASLVPSPVPTIFGASRSPTITPSDMPSSQPTTTTKEPSSAPTDFESDAPSSTPTIVPPPTATPSTATPSTAPVTTSSTEMPTALPTMAPSPDGVSGSNSFGHILGTLLTMFVLIWV